MHRRSHGGKVRIERARRTAWVLLHWLKGNFDSPRPLPDFQFARS